MRVLIDLGVFIPLPAKRIQTNTKTLGSALNPSIPMVKQKSLEYQIHCYLNFVVDFEIV